MARVSRHKTAAIVLMALFATACGSGPAAPSTTGPSPDPTTETFTGTVAVGGSDMHPFNIALSNGQVNIILTQAGPPSTIYMGLGVGAPSGSGCTIFSGGSTVTQAGPTAQLAGSAGAGAYCVQVFDVGNQTADVTYTVTVSHY
jgi:hypothetical protein